MPDTPIDDETLKADLEFLLECDYESEILERVIRNTKYPDVYDGDGYVTETLSVLIISQYRKPVNEYDHQWLHVRYITPNGERGFGELYYAPDPAQMSIMARPFDVDMELLTDQGRERTHFVAEGLRSGELVSDE